jgi:transcriptional regulator with XRE-family HTH domain
MNGVHACGKGDRMKFQDRLRELRDAVGLTEADLARESGVALGTLHNYGQGLR